MKKITGIVGVIATVLLGIVPGFTAQAAVAFNTFPIKYAPETNFDLPMIDARNVTQAGTFSVSQADHDNGVSADAGDTIEFLIYYHNSGVAEDEATNVIVKAVLAGGTKSTHEVSASIKSDQTSEITSSALARGGNININISGAAQTLEFVSGSVKHYPNKSTTATIPTLGDNLVTSTGLNIGTVKGCFDFSGFVSFRARVGQATVATHSLTITKRVLNVTAGETTFKTSTNADPSDKVRFQIKVASTGTADETNVKLTDDLPTKLTFVTGTMKIDNVVVTLNEDNIFTTTAGRNLGTLAAGTTKTILFDATVAGSSSFTASQTLTNTGKVLSDDVARKQDSADVTVNAATSVTRGLTINKRVENVTRGDTSFQDSVTANPGDKVRFEIRVETTGSASQNNVTVRDILPTQLTWVTGTVKQDGVAVTSEADLFGSGRNWGTLSAAVTRVITFDATIGSSSLFTGNTTLTNTSNVRSDEVSTKQDDATVYVQLLTSTLFQKRKTAYNLTQGADATTVVANPRDVITYTLYYKNTGTNTAVGVLVEDDISDVKELSTVTNTGNAVSVNGTIKYAAADVLAGVEIARTFEITVLPGSSFPTSSDLVMVNTYGNEVRVRVRKPLVAGAISPPRTGAGEWLPALLALAATGTYWIYRRKKITQEAEPSN